MSTVFRCEALVTHAGAPVEFDMAIVVRDGAIARVLPFAELDPVQDEDSVTRLAGLTLPGLIDAHSHLRSAPAVHQAKLPNLVLEQWLYALGGLTDLPDLEDQRLAAHELVGAGITSAQILSHTWAGLPGRLSELSATIGAIRESGLRALLVLGLTDQAEFTPLPLPAELSAVEDPERGITASEWPELVERAAALVADPADRITLGVGPVAPQWCSDEALTAIALSRDGRRVHTHLHESPTQRTWLGDGESPIERLDRAGLLGEFTSAAHGVDLNDAEIERLAGAHATLVHCPVSNRTLGVGAANVAQWERHGVQTALGLDSQSRYRPDPFAEMRAARETANSRGQVLTATTVLEMATSGGAAALGIRAGALAPGMLADFVSLAFTDLDPVDSVDPALAGETIAERIVAEASPELVGTVVIGGTQHWPVSTDRLHELAKIERLLEALIRVDTDGRERRMTQRTETIDALAGVVGAGR
ncbi:MULTISPECIES: amidohydrolase family protein [unclassified Leucobacter]|uniref:amidohydrolase family protein n=1 Tax=unclassified Leucobacter TaxID=2621730 RepID=UPI00165D763C|nr:MULTISPECIES: amidohydrolase family protein [unclassified Leucobacter]MBC9935837.1 amidohydrolase family protein [Leucobacter sp. cx-87]